MTDNPFEPFEDEEEPESLRKKWDAEDARGQVFRDCPHCERPVESASFFCLYCGERVVEETGLLSRLALLVKQGRLLVILALVILAFFFLSVLR